MKKIILRIITTILVLSSIIPGTSVVNASRLTNDLQDTELLKSKNLEMQSDTMIQDVEQYIEVREDGTIGFKNNIPMLIYKKYNLNDLQAHFDTLNQKVEDNEIFIDQHLNITDNSISTYASYNQWTYYWWGYAKKFTNSGAIDYANKLEMFALGSGAAGILFPPISGVAGLTAVYYELQVSRIRAKNKGNGVQINITWARVFTVKTL